MVLCDRKRVADLLNVVHLLINSRLHNRTYGLTDSRTSYLSDFPTLKITDQLSLRLNILQLTMSVAIHEIDDEANQQPYTETNPVADAEFAHHVQTAEQSEYRNER